MAKIEASFFDISHFDTLARGDSAIHGLDPRAKVITTLAFIFTVVSFGKYEIAALIPFCLFPVALVALADLPVGYLMKKLLVAAPFAFFIGIFNPLFDQQVLLELGGVSISGGWVSFGSILLRFVLTVFAALVLIATTGFTGVCSALERLGAPRAFALQLLFLYRYLFVLVEEALRMNRARTLRSFKGRGMEMKTFGHLVGQLLLRTIDRAQRIHQAMLCRGFDGEVHQLRPRRFGRPEFLFTLGWCTLFATLRLVPLPHLVGRLIMELIR